MTSRTDTPAGLTGRFARDESGPTTVEYAVMLALIVLAAVAAISSIGLKGAVTYNTLTDSLPNAS